MSGLPNRRYPIGAELTSQGVAFRVWAPLHNKLGVVLSTGEEYPLTAEGNGYFSRVVPAAEASLYKFKLLGGTFPDPASRFQPEGPFEWSQVIDPSFPWTDQNWKGCKLPGQIMYEMHLGTFTKEGTWKAAEEQLEELAATGITVIEVMPVADFAGSFGWGYDGVNFFAPCRLYGTPNDFRSFVNSAHAVGVGVILDVVYNHGGPAGNFLGAFSKSYFTDRYTTDWGEAINYDGDDAKPVREFFISNASYWIEEFHLDGLRLDATQNIYDAGPTHILEEIGRAVRGAAHGRDTIVVAENEPQDSRLVRPPDKSGYQLDGMWNDDFHHTAMVALTGHNEAYYGDYSGSPQELISTFKHGFLYQGQRSGWQHKPRGTPSLDINASSLVFFLENHDQVANSMRGYRLDRLTHPGRLRALTTLLLLAPGTPLLFQGQEFGSSVPFRYFSDLGPDLGNLVIDGRAEFMSQFRSYGGTSDIKVVLPDPTSLETFQQCKLDFSDRERHSECYSLHKDLIKLRKTDPVFRSMAQSRVDGAVLGGRTFLIRYFAPDSSDRILLINLDIDLHRDTIPEPLLAPPAGSAWQVLFSSENPKYGGNGCYQPDKTADWRIPGESAIVLSAVPTLPSIE